MKPQFRLKNSILMMALAGAYPLIGHAAAGRVEFAAGTVVAVTATGSQRPLGKGSALESGDTIRTSDGARAQIRFTDGSMLSLQPQTEFRIDDYRFEGKSDGGERGFFSLIKGGLRTITGLVGRTNRDSYRISTSVATIGIRGTEYAVRFTGGQDGQLSLATGEGAIEVCNAGGCVTVAGGESAIVTGNNSQPRRTESRPALPPAAATEPAAVTYSTSENRNSSGTLSLFGPDLVSGSGYAAAWTYKDSASSHDIGSNSSVTATFAEASKLTAINAGTIYKAETVVGSFSFDGVIGWGLWSPASYNSGTALSSLHYVVGKPTTDFTGIHNMTGTYSLIGYTNPTSSLGSASVTSGSLTAAFDSSGSVNVQLNLSVQAGSTNYSYSGSTWGSSTFSMSGSVTGGGSGATASVQGLFAGSNASHAGIVYKINDGSDVTSGAAAFKQQSLTTTPPSSS